MWLQDEKDLTEILIAVSDKDTIMGAVVYFGEIKNYGSGGTATALKNVYGFRLLAVDPRARGKGKGINKITLQRVYVSCEKKKP